MADKKISQLANATTPLIGTEVLPIVQGNNTVKVNVNNLTEGRSVTVSELTTNGNILAGATSNFANCRILAENGTGQQLGARYSGIATHYLSVESNGDAVFNRDGTEWARIINSSLDFKVATGNLVIGTSGKGIDFSATSQAGGMTSELLADYEEGTWTPAFGAYSGSFGSITYTVQTGQYTKIGNMVTAFFYIVVDTVTTGTAATITTVTGLPFVFSDGIGQTPYIGNWVSKGPDVMQYSGTGTTMLLRYKTATGVANVPPSEVQAGTQLQAIITYFV